MKIGDQVRLRQAVASAQIRLDPGAVGRVVRFTPRPAGRPWFARHVPDAHWDLEFPVAPHMHILVTIADSRVADALELLP